jgi:cell division septal protein FtsQ
MSKRKIILFLSLSSVVIFLFIVFANNWRNKTYINKITVKGNITLSEAEVLSAAGIKADSVLNLEELNLSFIRDRVAKHPEIKKVIVSKEPPSELIIEITEKKPLAVIIKNNELNLIDDEQEVFTFKNYEKAYDLPVISGLKPDGSPQYKSDINMALNLLKAAYSKGRYLQNMISEVNMKDSNKVIVKSNEKSISFYFPRIEKDALLVYKQKLGLFKKFMEEEILKKNLECQYVYIRYSNQIIAKFN